MLTTLLSIGKTLREQPGSAGIQHHRYIRRIPTLGKGQAIRKYVVFVADDMTFDLSSREEARSEITDDLFFLNYKTSGQDTMKKYVFGDICRYMEKKPTEAQFSEAEVNFVLGTPGVKEGNAYQLNSFERGRPDAESLDSTNIKAFRSCLASQMDSLLALFEQEKSVYINFRFGPYHWYELETELSAVNKKLLSEFVETVPGGGYVLTKSLHKTLAADKGAMPQFREESAFKAWLFPSLSEVSDLLYAIDLSQKAMIRKGDIKIVVLPRSDEDGRSRLTAQDIVQFFDAKGLRQAAGQEESVSDMRAVETDTLDADGDSDDETTRPYLRAKDVDVITKFDFIFSRASSSPSSPDVDVIELAGVEKSRIGELYSQIKAIRSVLNNERDIRFQRKGFILKKPPFPLSILSAFNSILAEVGREKKKYSSHLLKVLPQIYCGSYIQDDLLLPTFIKTTERFIRDGSSNYDFLRFDLLFLWSLQDVNRKDFKMVEKIHDTKSFKVGQLLGKMARPLRSKINSFEKNYVGLISRRLAQVHDLISFQNYIDEKLLLHDCAYPNLKIASRELAAMLCSFHEADSRETYNREYCVFGFFEAYFEPIPKKESGVADADLTPKGDEAEQRNDKE